jgi:hypothetical protein
VSRISSAAAILLGMTFSLACRDGEEPSAVEAPEAGVRAVATPTLDAGLTTAEGASGPRDQMPGPADAGGAQAIDAASVDSGATLADAATSDARQQSAMEAGSAHDGASDGSAPLFDAAGLVAPTPKEVAAILAHWCGGCHQNPGPDGFIYDGELRATLLASVEAPATPLGDPPGAAACRRELRVRPGDPNSYLLRKLELGIGHAPNPPVCGQGMPAALVLEPSERAMIPRDLELLRLWVAAGAPLK